MEDFLQVSFDVLPAEILLDLLKRLKPPSVLRLCQTEIATASFCQDQSVFRALLKAHYPDEAKAFLYSDELPKDLYMKLAANYVTYFTITVETRDDDCGRLDLSSIERRSVDDWGQSTLDIIGDPAPGSEVWVYSRFISDDADFRTYAYPTIEEAIQGAYDQYLEDRYYVEDQRDTMLVDDFSARIQDPNDCVMLFLSKDDAIFEKKPQIIYTLDFITLP